MNEIFFAPCECNTCFGSGGFTPPPGFDGWGQRGVRLFEVIWDFGTVEYGGIPGAETATIARPLMNGLELNDPALAQLQRLPLSTGSFKLPPVLNLGVFGGTLRVVNANDFEEVQIGGFVARCGISILGRVAGGFVGGPNDFPIPGPHSFNPGPHTTIRGLGPQIGVRISF